MDHGRGLAPGTMIAGEWRIERTLGVGGFGVTYEARNSRTQAHVALKEYMPAGCCSRDPKTSHVTAAPGREGEVFLWGRERFMKEAETLARLEHPSIVRVSTYFEANGTAYMGLAFEPHGTLRDWLDCLDRRPTEAEIDALLWPLLDALSQVHSLFLLHRDIKPDNIMVRADGTPVLIDFGAARSAVAGHTQTLGGVNPAATSAFAVVSDGYSPPEQYDPTGKMTGPASDIYSLGGTVYTALVGGRPPSAASRHFGDDYQPLAKRLAGQGYRHELLAGIDRALAVHPRDRPQSAIEFRRAIGLAAPPRDAGLLSRALTDLATERGVTRPPPLPSGPRPVTFSQLPISDVPKSPRSRAPHAIVVGLAALVLAGMAFATQDRWLPARVGAVAKTETDRRLEAIEAQLKAERAAREKAEARAKAEEAERLRLSAVQAEEAQKRVEASRRDPVAALLPGSGQSARDRLAGGGECAFCPEMVVVPAGRFTMGSPENEPQRESGETQNAATIARPFAVGKFEVTFEEWDACMRESACTHKPGDEGWGRGRRPVINVSWDDAQQYVTWLSRKTGKTYRLLSEAEWEYAARAGTTTPFWWGSSITPSQANYDGSTEPYPGGGSKGEYRKQTVAVGSFRANAWGLHDVHGNVWEWAEDCWSETNGGNPANGSARTSGNCSHRVLRGGSWSYVPRLLRSASRFRFTTGLRILNIGFRVGRSLDP